jgi:hypothetical protein
MGDIETGEPLLVLESVEQNQVAVKENCLQKYASCIATSVNIIFILALMIGVIVGILKINDKI